MSELRNEFSDMVNDDGIISDEYARQIGYRPDLGRSVRITSEGEVFPVTALMDRASNRTQIFEALSKDGFLLHEDLIAATTRQPETHEKRIPAAAEYAMDYLGVDTVEELKAEPKEEWRAAAKEKIYEGIGEVVVLEHPETGDVNSFEHRPGFGLDFDQR